MTRALIPLVPLVLLVGGVPVLAASAIDAFGFEDAQAATRYQRLLAEFRCPKCLNESLASSGAPIAVDLRRTVRRLLDAGESDDSIRAYLQARYGDFVLYDPAPCARPPGCCGSRRCCWRLWLESCWRVYRADQRQRQRPRNASKRTSSCRRSSDRRLAWRRRGGPVGGGVCGRRRTAPRPPHGDKRRGRCDIRATTPRARSRSARSGPRRRHRRSA